MIIGFFPSSVNAVIVGWSLLWVLRSTPPLSWLCPDSLALQTVFCASITAGFHQGLDRRLKQEAGWEEGGGRISLSLLLASHSLSDSRCISSLALSPAGWASPSGKYNLGFWHCTPLSLKAIVSQSKQYWHLGAINSLLRELSCALQNI